MRKARVVAMLLVWAGQAVAAGARPVEPWSGARRIPARLVGGRFLVVPVTVDGTGPYPFLLDTGSTCTLVDPVLAERLRLPRAGQIQHETATGTRPSDLVRATLALGGVERRGVEFISTPLDSVRALDARIDGVIGQDLLRGANWWLDYRGKAVIEDAAGALADSTVGERLTVRWAVDRPVVEASLRDGRPLRLVLDSAADALLLFRQPGDAGESVGTGLLRTQAGAAEVEMVAVGPLRLGRVVIPGLAAGVVAGLSRPEDGLLPTALFDAVYFDNHGGAVVINARRTP